MTVFKGHTNFYEFSFTDLLQYNLREMFNYGLMQMGAYTVVDKDDPNTDSFATLQRTTDPRWQNKIYEGLGASWIWQENADVPSGMTQPFRVSGVYVNNSFIPNDESQYIVDYRNGRVIFFNQRSSSDVVQCNYCFNDVAIYLSDDRQFRTIVNHYTDKFVKAGGAAPSGLSSYLKEDRVWLPCFVIDVKDRPYVRGLQLGGGDIQEFGVFYHIFTEEPFTRNRLLDVIVSQYHKRVRLFNPNVAGFNFGTSGNLLPTATEYPDLIDEGSNAFVTHARVMGGNSRSMGSWTDLYRGEASARIEVDRGVNSLFLNS